MKKKKRRIYVRNAPKFYPRRPIPYECPVCGEDRAHMFMKVRGVVRCRVCWYKAKKGVEIW